MQNTDLARELLNQGNNTLMAATAVRAGVPRAQLSMLVKQGLLERASRGVYVKTGEIDDELFSMQQRAKKIVYSHETALFLHRLTDRTPILHSITVPDSYKPSSSIKERCKVYYIKADLVELGKTTLPSGMGHEIVAYDAERTICDVLRSRNRIDSQIFIEALKKYAGRRDIDLNRLDGYARQFDIDRLLHQYLEVLL